MGEEILYEIMSGVFVIAARIYDIMLNLIDSTYNMVNYEGLVDKVYVAAGIFMLFRITVGLLQMLVNPDQVSDKNAGAGKLMVRVFTVLLLLILFYPQSILFKSDGLVNRMQDAIISDEGLLDRFFSDDSFSGIDLNYNDTDDGDSTNKDSNKNTSTKGSYKICYFAMDPTTNLATTHVVNSTIYKIAIYKTKCEGCTQIREKVYAKSVSGQRKYDGTIYSFNRIALNNVVSDYVTANDNVSKVSNCSNWYVTYSSWPQLAHDPSATTLNSGNYYKGYNNFKTMVKAINKNKEDDPEAYENDLKAGIAGASPEAVNFATDTISAFEECTVIDKEELKECEITKKFQFGGHDEIDEVSSKTIPDLMSDDMLKLMFLTGCIAGIAIEVFLVMLCVDVVIRNLKLMLLSVLAPIPIMSYVDPKDKVFMNWVKMYVSVYLDLFIKLFALRFAVILIGNLDTEKTTGIEFLFVIMAILLFAKMIPDIISKIFGIDMNGSMKDIGGMLKKGVGLAARGAGTTIGGVVGGVVGGASGKGIGGRVMGALGGMFGGARSGSKGDILGGSKKIAAFNKKSNDMKADGLDFFDRMWARTYGATGITPSGAEAQKKMEAAANVQSKYAELKDFAKGEVKTKGHTMSADTMSKFGNIAAKNDEGRVVAGYTEKLDSDGNAVLVSVLDGDTSTGISMQDEYIKQNKLAGMTQNEYNAMSNEDKVKYYDKKTGETVIVTDVNEAQGVQNQRVTALEDYSTADYLNTKAAKNDQEVLQKIEAVNDSVDDASKLGVSFKQVSTRGAIDNKTFSDAKDATIASQRQIAKESEKERIFQKHVEEKK